MKGRVSKEQMKILWPTVKQSFEKFVRESKQAGDTNAGVAARIIERHGADVHLPSGDGGEAAPTRPKRNLPNNFESLKDVLRTAGVSVGLAGAFNNMINSVKSVANIKTIVSALGDREAAMQTLLAVGEAGVAVDIKRNEQRCKRNTCVRKDYCWQHLRSKLGIDVRPSTLAGTGMGLFCLQSVSQRQ
jgi:hypothetical protein